MATTTTTSADTSTRFSEAELEAYHRDGFTVLRGLFAPEEVKECKDFFDDLAARGESLPGHWAPKIGKDVLARYPRVFHPHLFDEGSKKRLLDSRVRSALVQLLGEEPVAVQSMFYFKPPGARGQAFHQDNYYLRIKPDTCIAAWLAIDRASPENGGLQLCAGTHNYEVQCPEEADESASFTRDFVKPPEGHEPSKLVLEPGDVLFFNGSVVHGSDPNQTTDTWRRSFISHYAPASSTHIGRWFHSAVMDFDGNPIVRDSNEDGGPCGEEFYRGESAIH